MSSGVAQPGPAATGAPLRALVGPGAAAAGGGVAVTLTWGAGLWVAGHVDADPALATAALFVHLVALVVGFGAVLAIDWLGTLWLLGRLRLDFLLHVAAYLRAPIWLGLSALLVSGVLLGPDLDSAAVRVKLLLVLLVGWNGVLVEVLQRRLRRLGSTPPGRPLLLVAAAVALTSQAGWWGALMIAFLRGR